MAGDIEGDEPSKLVVRRSPSRRTSAASTAASTGSHQEAVKRPSKAQNVLEMFSKEDALEMSSRSPREVLEEDVLDEKKGASRGSSPDGTPRASKASTKSMSKDRKTGGSSPDCTPRASKASKKSTSKDHWGGIPSKEERKHGIETLEDVFDIFDPQDGTGGLNAYRFNKFLERVGGAVVMTRGGRA